MPFDSTNAAAGLDRLVQALDPAAQRQQLAAFARQQLAGLQQSGAVPVGKGAHRTFVNGREGIAEEQVQLPGPIVYVFNWLDPVVGFALAYLQARAPKRSGRYRNSFFALVNGARVKAGTPIPPSAEVIITNDQPYARKIDVGAMKMSVPPHLFNDAYNALRKEFRGLIAVTVTHVGLSNGYRLRRQGRRRRDAAGTPITYPALVIRAV